MADPADVHEGFVEPEGRASDWDVYAAGPDDAAKPGDLELVGPPSGPRVAAFGVIVVVVAALLLVLGLLAGFGPLAWLAGAGVAIGLGMILAGYRRYALEA